MTASATTSKNKQTNKKLAHAKRREKKKKRLVSSLHAKAQKAATFSRQPALSLIRCAIDFGVASTPQLLPGFFFYRPCPCGFRSSYFSLPFRLPLYRHKMHHKYTCLLKTGSLYNAIREFEMQFIGLAIMVYEPLYQALQIW